jgi:hypothetical protein
MDRLLINLEIIARLQHNERLGTEGDITFVIYPPSLMNAVSRRLNGERRALNVDRLSGCVDHAVSRTMSLFYELYPVHHGGTLALPHLGAAGEVVAGSPPQDEPAGVLALSEAPAEPPRVELARVDTLRDLQKLVGALTRCIPGLENLATTYAADVSTSARIRTLVNGVRQCLEQVAFLS